MFLLSESYIRIGCVNHAFHNVVGDGLKGAGARVGNCVEESFGRDVGNSRSVKTRWNSALKQAEEFLATLTDEGKFDNVIDKYNDKKAAAQKGSFGAILLQTSKYCVSLI